MFIQEYKPKQIRRYLRKDYVPSLYCFDETDTHAETETDVETNTETNTETMHIVRALKTGIDTYTIFIIVCARNRVMLGQQIHADEILS